MAGKRIFITGGAGYVGTSLVERLALSPSVEEIKVYDNLSRPNHNFFLGKSFENNDKVSFVNGDLLDSRKLKMQLAGMDTVFHLAARVTTPFANTDSHQFEQVNHWGTAELVYAVEESEVEQFIYTSSTSVYGASQEEVNEQTPPNPKTFYGMSKRRGEEHVERLQDKLNTIILRCGNVYGYNRSMRFDAVINRFMFDAHFNNRISIHGDGTQKRAFLHIDHLSEVLAQVVQQEVPSGTYNLLDKNRQVLDVVDVLKEIYPELEFIFINQHLHLRELTVSAETALSQYIAKPETGDLKKELEAFKQHFSF